MYLFEVSLQTNWFGETVSLVRKNEINTKLRRQIILNEVKNVIKRIFLTHKNECIKKFNSYKYLGINFNEEGTDDAEIKSRINKAKQISSLV